ncbi:MAG: RNA 3'-terminal phosphate cyclase [Nanoarchaeota archaeon]|nr:RNA 3'-terminal phosphate cyclase [Nanoarchaeota archaeon]
MIELDGAYKEGGGQILRTALALSTILQKPFEVNSIRKARPNPGLKNQHLFCIKALQQLCNAKVEGAELGSDYVRYIPEKIKGKTININIETAGSITLLLQSLLLPCLFAKENTRLNITGGTDVRWSMPFDYFNQVFIPQISKYAEKIDTALIRRGYYPKGSGKIGIKIKPLENIKQAPKINLTEQGNPMQIKGISHASKDLEKAEVAERQAGTAKLILNRLNTPIQIQTEYNETLSTGSGIVLWAVFSKNPEETSAVNPIRLGADALGERGKRAEQVGKEAAEKLLDEISSKAPVDRHLADNIIPFLGLFGGEIKTSKITNHTLTNIYVVEKFLGKRFNIEDKVITAINKI